MKTDELIGSALDWAVAKCEGYTPDKDIALTFSDSRAFRYSTNWSQGGPIIENEAIALHLSSVSEEWFATDGFDSATGDTPLIAAMRCYVKSQLGNEVDVPTFL